MASAAATAINSLIGNDEPLVFGAPMLRRGSPLGEMIGFSESLRHVQREMARVSPTNATVLITGESGTGKELVARGIHRMSNRSGGPFIRLNCASIAPSLLASELFGHEKGSFTGADQRRVGRFEAANGGTIFLDEIGEIPAETQVALLRVLQEREIERVGSSRPIPVDVRVVAATNRNLRNSTMAGEFRLDLYYRLNVFPIHVPPLRDRKNDLPVLVDHFLELNAKKLGRRISFVAPETMKLLTAYRWPGNIRELQNIIERAVISSDNEVLRIDESWLSIGAVRETAVAVAAETSFSASHSHERDTIMEALKACRGRVSGPSGAAIKLGMPASTLESKIRSLAIDKYKYAGQFRRA